MFSHPGQQKPGVFPAFSYPFRGGSGEFLRFKRLFYHPPARLMAFFLASHNDPCRIWVMDSVVKTENSLTSPETMIPFLSPMG